MAGQNARYDAVSHFTSEVFDLRVSVWGEAKAVDHHILRAGAAGDDLVEIGVAADGRVAQVVALNHPGENEALRKLVQSRFNVSGAEERLRDPNAKLMELL